ncbi:sigma-54-dependent transcriptional regulator [Azohydromonas aeria]|uniref:sigma-54-dependent transcriptional regulator n=1 Tax=Azohydromonas aeria TaxID=2590212 RepID=UPI0012F7DFAE|nr:sigma-54 dependent transcriptional regulator [Azohydromonas aeria]
MDDEGRVLPAGARLHDATGSLLSDPGEWPAPEASAPDTDTDADAALPRRLLCICARRPPQLHALLRKAGWDVIDAPDLAAATRLLSAQPPAVALIASTASDEDSWKRLGDFVAAHGDVVWIALLERSSLQHPACLDVVLGGLFDYHHWPLDAARLLMTLGHAHGYARLRRLHQHQRHARDGVPGVDLITCSAAAQRLLAQVRRIAPVNAPVLVHGDSGSGKELAARAIHRCSARRHAPFVTVHCGAGHGALLEEQLFGHAAGGSQGGCGRIEAADGGTLYLDEVGDLPLAQQLSLLRFLQEGTVHRPGMARGVEVDVRVIAATHADLEQAMRAGRFRQDLYYRLSVLHLQVPALRQRQEDIAPLALHFYALYAHEGQPGLRGFSRAALASLQAHDWPGNVRELANRVRRAAVMAEGRLIRPEDLGLLMPLPSPLPAAPAEALDRARTDAERSAIVASLQRTGNNVSRSARELGVSRMTLYRLMAKHGIQG